MPQFIMNDKHAPEFQSLDEFTQGYIEALFWTEEERLCEESDGASKMPSVVFNRTTLETSYQGGSLYGFEDLAPKALEKIIADCAKFQSDAAVPLSAMTGPRSWQGSTKAITGAAAGSDFWLTRNGHGAGFTDGSWPDPYASQLAEAAKAFGECDLYLGDDGKVYTS